MGSEHHPVVEAAAAGKPRTIRDRLLRLGFVQRAIAREPDLSLFRRRLSARMAFGLFCIAISYVIAWPLMTVLTVLTAWMGRPWIGVIGSPVLYGLSWVVWTVGIWIAGRDSLQYGRALGTWVIRRFARRYLIEPGNS